MERSIRSDHDYDCLDFYPTNELAQSTFDTLYKQNHQIIPFCRRDNINDEIQVTGDDILSFTFDELKERHVTSQELIAWSAPIELAELYQGYLELKKDRSTRVGSLQFHNCSSGNRFGHFCQYSFHINVSKSPKPNFNTYANNSSQL